MQCIFTLGTKNLGIYTKRGSGLVVMVRFTPDICLFFKSHYLFRAWEVELGSRPRRPLSLIDLAHGDRISFLWLDTLQ